MKGPRPGPSEGTAALFGAVIAGVARLVQGEMALAKAEARDGMRSVMQALVLIGVAVILAVTAANLLAGSAVAGLVALGLKPAVAAVVLALLLGLAALMLISRARTKWVPRRSFYNLRRDAAAVKSMVSGDANE